MDDVEFELMDDGTEDSVVAIFARGPFGELQMMAEIRIEERALFLDGFHIHGLRANALGIGSLRKLAEAAMERMDFDEIIIQGATRTSGACQGRRPSTLRFTRRLQIAGE